MYPLKFENLYYDRIWGGRELEKYRTNLPDGNIGESWDVACHKNGMSIIENGKYKGLTLIDLIKINGKEIIGEKFYKKNFVHSDFPLLLKIINSKENLSVQVHPGDEYAQEKEGDNGKVEVWYIIDAEEDSEIIVGTKRCNKEEFKRSCVDGTVEKHMNKIKVKKGEMYFIESGLVHAIGKGIVLAEIQQNSDTTYRVYDYNRGREIHMDKALDVIDFDLKPKKIVAPDEEEIQKCVRDKAINLDIYNICGQYEEFSFKDKFSIFTCIEGEGRIIFTNDETKMLEEENIVAYESILIPASLGRYKLSGNMKLMKTYK